MRQATWEARETNLSPTFICIHFSYFFTQKKKNFNLKFVQIGYRFCPGDPRDGGGSDQTENPGHLGQDNPT